MRILLFTLLWAFTFAPNLSAQGLGQDYPILIEWETFIEDHQTKSAPDEQAILLKIQSQAAVEKTTPKPVKDLIQSIRANYWRSYFLDKNRKAINAALKAKKAGIQYVQKSAAQVLNNPPMIPERCDIDIVIIVDRSSSINDSEDNIRDGLLDFINNQHNQNTGNTLTFVGMGNDNTPVIISETITYEPGDLNSHTNWLENELTFSGNRDSWSSGLTAAAGLSPELVLLISNDNRGHGGDEADLNLAAANVLKEAGAHLFVIADEDASFIANSLFEEVQNVVDPNPMEATVPLSTEELYNYDYLPVNDFFADLGVWLSVIEGVLGTAEITNIQGVKGPCLEGELCFSGRWDLCKGVNFGNVAPQLIFSQNGVEIASPILVLNNDGTFFRCWSKQDLVDMGLDLNTGYDVFVEITTTDGVITSPPYIDGVNNDFTIVPNNGYVDLNFVGVIPGSCFNNEVCFSGVYDLCEGNSESTPTTISFEQNGNEVASVTLTLNSDGTFYSCYSEALLISLGLESGSSYDAFININTTDGYSLTTSPYVPGLNNDFTIDYIGDGEVAITNIAQEGGLCLEAETCISGTYTLCPGVNASTPTILTFGQNGQASAYAPITLLEDGTFEECFTNQELLELGLGLDSGESYDVTAQISTDGGGSPLTSPPYVAGFNNDFFFAAYDADILPISVPDCVEEGVPFQITVHFDNIITDADIENIYSDNNLYTYISHTITYPQAGTNVIITFESNTCSCAGEMLTFDIAMVGCSTPIWLMTHDPIPCCVTECTSIRVTDWEAGDCFYYNGDIARPFTINITSPSPIIDIIAVSNIATCQTTVADLEVTYVSGNDYVISGTMVFADPDCIGTAWLSFLIENKSTCCSIDQQFSFPKGCNLKPCNIGPVVPQIIAHNSPPIMSVSVNLPIGTSIQVIDNLTGVISNATVQQINCGPFQVDQSGNPSGGTPCNGILITAPFNFDCRKNNNESTAYNYTISSKKCDWVIGGDFCEVPTIYPFSPGLSQSGSEALGRSEENAAADTPAKTNGFANQINFYPNPIQSTSALNFDFSRTEVSVQSIRITNLSGQVVEMIIPPADRSTFSHPLSRELSQGVYFVLFGLENGQIESKKLIAF